MAEGTLYLIVGPSGAGKDTLIDGARAALADNPGFVFARRFITRPVGSGGENHQAATDEEFRTRENAGGFMIAWRAHGLSYGLEQSLQEDLAMGRHVIANVSRAVLGELVERFPSHRIVEVTAAPEILAERLAHRGRESAPEIAVRLAREAENYPSEANLISLNNAQTPEAGVSKFLAILKQAQC